MLSGVEDSDCNNSTSSLLKSCSSTGHYLQISFVLWPTPVSLEIWLSFSESFSLPPGQNQCSFQRLGACHSGQAQPDSRIFQGREYPRRLGFVPPFPPRVLRMATQTCCFSEGNAVSESLNPQIPPKDTCDPSSLREMSPRGAGPWASILLNSPTWQKDGEEQT